MADDTKRHPKNVPGDFYVLDGCCTLCGVPEHAPEVFEFDTRPEVHHCYVKHQPSTPDELERTLQVMRWQELGCIRYAGSDEVIRHRLAEAGEGTQCDVPPPPGIEPVLRNHVAVDAGGPVSRSWDAADLLDQIRFWLGRRRPSYRVTAMSRSGSTASFSFSWFEDNFHELIAEQRDGEGQWLIRHSGNLGVSEILDEWFRSTQELGPAKWYSPDEWRRRGPGRDRPW